MIALSLMVLAGYGGMVSLAQMTVAGIAGYTVAIFGHNSSACMGFGWPWWVVVPVRDRCSAAVARPPDRADRGPHRRHLHDHDHARDRDRLLLFRAAELCAVQRPSRASPASRRRPCSASTGAIRFRSTISALAVAAACLCAPCSTARARPSAWRCRRSATTRAACARSASTSPRIKVVAYVACGRHRRARRRAAGLVQRPHFAGHDRRRPSHRHAGHRGDRRHAPSDRAVHRRARLCPAQDLRHRYRRRRALQYADRARLSG